MIIQIATKRTYIPKWNKNRELPEDEQIVAEYTMPGLKDKARLIRKPAVKFQYDPQGNVTGGEAEVGFERRPILEAMLTKLVNCGWKDADGNTKTLAKFKDFDEAPTEFDSLADELADHFRSELEKKPDEKN